MTISLRGLNSIYDCFDARPRNRDENNKALGGGGGGEGRPIKNSPIAYVHTRVPLNLLYYSYGIIYMIP